MTYEKFSCNLRDWLEKKMIKAKVEEQRNSLSFDSMLFSSFGEASLNKSQSILCTKRVLMKKHNFVSNYEKEFKREKIGEGQEKKGRRWRLNRA